MIKSMTGYGKAEYMLPSGKITIEIRSLNGKNTDVNIKTSIFPRDKELELRQFIANELHRGSIDLFAVFEQNSEERANNINKELFAEYYKQILDLGSIICNIQKDYLTNGGRSEDFASNKITGCERETILSTILNMPYVIESNNKVITDDDWDILFETIRHAVDSLKLFRDKEGIILYGDVTKRVHLIESYVNEVEKYEAERISSIKERIKSRIEELNIQPDENRLEQEIIFYIEKLDINEEKVRLRQHCKYFMETIDNEPYPGKKLGFIAQEMGREINTLGSKANHAQIQQWVVKMKDELEKIKEQTLNIL